MRCLSGRSARHRVVVLGLWWGRGGSCTVVAEAVHEDYFRLGFTLGLRTLSGFALEALLRGRIAGAGHCGPSMFWCRACCRRRACASLLLSSPLWKDWNCRGTDC